MQKIVLKKSVTFDIFLLTEYQGDSIFFLYDCVHEFRLSEVDRYLKWASNPNEVYMGFNVAELEKDGEFILIGSELSEPEDGGPFYKIKIQEFIKMIHAWSMLTQKGVETIIITDNDGVIEITGN